MWTFTVTFIGVIIYRHATNKYVTIKHGFEGNMAVYRLDCPVSKLHIARKYMFYLLYYTESMN